MPGRLGPAEDSGQWGATEQGSYILYRLAKTRLAGSGRRPRQRPRVPASGVAGGIVMCSQREPQVCVRAYLWYVFTANAYLWYVFAAVCVRSAIFRRPPRSRGYLPGASAPRFSRGHLDRRSEPGCSESESCPSPDSDLVPRRFLRLGPGGCSGARLLARAQGRQAPAPASRHASGRRL